MEVVVVVVVVVFPVAPATPMPFPPLKLPLLCVADVKKWLPIRDNCNRENVAGRPPNFFPAEVAYEMALLPVLVFAVVVVERGRGLFSTMVVWIAVVEGDAMVVAVVSASECETGPSRSAGRTGDPDVVTTCNGPSSSPSFDAVFAPRMWGVAGGEERSEAIPFSDRIPLPLFHFPLPTRYGGTILLRLRNGLPAALTGRSCARGRSQESAGDVVSIALSSTPAPPPIPAATAEEGGSCSWS